MGWHRHDHHCVDMGWHADRALILSRQQPICTAAMTHMCALRHRHRHDDDGDDDEDDADDDDDGMHYSYPMILMMQNGVIDMQV